MCIRDSILYKGEVRKLSLREGTVISREKYDEIIYEILGTRAKKRAMFLLERMDRTEHQLREKLMQNGYPDAVSSTHTDVYKRQIPERMLYVIMGKNT